MIDIQDLVTDIASIVTSVRPREVMTLKRIEEDFKTIYGHSIPFYQHGFSSLTDLLEGFPNHFKFSIADGMLVIRTNVKNNITDLIAKEKNVRKSKGFESNSYNTSLFKKHKRRDLKVEAELPGIILRGISDVVEMSQDGIHKSHLLNAFKQHVGYDCKYQDYGFADLDELLRYLNNRVLMIRRDILSPLIVHDETLFDLLKDLLAKRTGYTLSTLQDQLCADTDTRIPIMMKAIGHVNFVDVIYEGHSRGILSYDHDLVYSPNQRRSLCQSTYPEGVNHINVVRAVNPSEFTFEIVANDNMQPREELHECMQQLAPNEPLLSMFKENRHCSIEFDGEWYRATIDEVSCDRIQQTVTIRFLDFPIEMDRGIVVSLPTDRLRFVPVRCEMVPAFVHRGGLGYVRAEHSGGLWPVRSCEVFRSMINDDKWRYEAFLVEETRDKVLVDVLATRADSNDRLCIFQRLVALGLAQAALNDL